MSALLGIEATAGLNASLLGLNFVNISAGTYEVGDGDFDNPLRQVTLDAFNLADTPTTNKQFAKGLKQLRGRTTVLMTELADHRWAILARGTEREVRKIEEKRLSAIIAKSGLEQQSFSRIGERFVSGALRTFNFGRQTKIVPVTLEAHLPARFRGPNQPALASPFEAYAFAALFGLALPIGVQWEAAAADLKDEKYRRKEKLRRVAHFYPARATANVGTREPNKFGLYDMLGDVWEVMANRYKEGRKARELRGGSWRFNIGGVRVALRDKARPRDWSGDVGFRLLRPSTP